MYTIIIKQRQYSVSARELRQLQQRGIVYQFSIGGEV